MKKIVLLFIFSILLACNVCSQQKTILKSLIKIEAYFEKDSVFLNDLSLINIKVKNISNSIMKLQANPVCYFARYGDKDVFIEYVKPFYSINYPDQKILNPAFANSKILKPNEECIYRLKIKIDDFFFIGVNKVQLIFLYPKNKELIGSICVEDITVYVK